MKKIFLHNVYLPVQIELPIGMQHLFDLNYIMVIQLIELSSQNNMLKIIHQMIL